MWQELLLFLSFYLVSGGVGTAGNMAGQGWV
jgi:hypothetical protein